MQIALIIALALGVAFWFYIAKIAAKNNKKPAPNTKKPTVKTNPEKLDGKYRCAEIKPGLVCCKAVEVLKKKVFLLSEVPQIPLSNCEISAACKCKYLRFNDRRREDRRDNVLKAVAVRQGYNVESIEEKRARRGRRATDTD